MITITASDLVKNSAHIGHKRHKTHAKVRNSLYKYESGVALIDSFVTATQANEAMEYLQKLGKSGKTLLVIGTKKVAKDITKKTAQSVGAYYLTSKWISGTLTNFLEIKKNLEKIDQLTEEKTTNAYKDLPKHEQMAHDKLLAKLIRLYDGIVQMRSLPDALFIVDAYKERNAISEAIKLGIPVAAISDTNADPSRVQYPIIGNDDSASSVEFLVSKVLSAYKLTKNTENQDEKAVKTA